MAIIDSHTGKPYYEYPQEVWDAARCAKELKKIWKDGMGTPGPNGLIQVDSDPYPHFGTRRFNGGIDIDGKWYTGYHRPYPKLAEGYYLESVGGWGVFIRKGKQPNKQK